MNKKALLTIVVILFAAVSSYAESPINLGFKAGINKSSLSTNFEDYLNKDFYTNDLTNYQVGAFLRLGVGSLYLQPEVSFCTKNAEFDVQDTESVINQFDLQTVDVPVLVGLKIINCENIKIRVNAGPVFCFVNNGSSIDMPSFSDFELSDLKDNYLGWQAGVGLDAWSVTLDARVEGCGNIVGKTDSGYKVKYTTFSLALGVKIF